MCSIESINTPQTQFRHAQTLGEDFNFEILNCTHCIPPACSPNRLWEHSQSFTVSLCGRCSCGPSARTPDRLVKMFKHSLCEHPSRVWFFGPPAALMDRPTIQPLQFFRNALADHSCRPTGALLDRLLGHRQKLISYTSHTCYILL